MKAITNCRVCGSSSLTELFSLGEQYVSQFLKKDEESGEAYPITLVLCENCTLVQLLHTAPQELLYRKFYWYRSGVTQTMRDALSDITEKVESMVSLDRDSVVLDIGSNDGTLLRSYTKPCYKVGVEPATNLAQEGSRNIDCFIGDFWDYTNYMFRVDSRFAKVITAIGMFYDLDDPNKFIKDVSRALSSHGIFVAQLMCLKNMLNLNDVGNLAHEHLEFYSFKSLEYLFNQHKLEIFDVEINNVNGESYRIFARLQGSNVPTPKGAEDRIIQIQEEEVGLNESSHYNYFYENMEWNKARTVKFVKHAVSQGKRVWVYGASTKGNVLLQYYGLDNTLIEGAAERSPEKWGKRTVGTNIPIYSEVTAREVNPDYFLVLPYTFLDEFIEREKEWRDKGGKFIVPLPKLEII